MSIRRMMLAIMSTFSYLVKSLIDDIKLRVLLAYGIFEAEACLKTQLDDVNNINLLQDATLVITPNGYNENILHTVKGNTITAAPYNLASFTESTTSWGLAQATFTTTSIANPFGVLTNVVSMTETVVSNSHRCNAPAFNVIFGKTYTASIYLKKGIGATAPDIMQLYFNTGFDITNYANFDIVSETVTDSLGVTTSITNIGSGWFRCSITMAATSTSAAGSFNIAFTNNNPLASRAVSYIGATTSNVSLFGLQIEENTISTTYQPVLFTQVLEQGYAQHTRSTTGYRVESTGLVREVPQENLLRVSEEFYQSLWTKQNGCTVTANQVTSPDGLGLADKINFTTDLLSRIEQQNIAIGIGKDYTFSVWLRADSNITLNQIMTNTQAVNVTTSWQRFSITITTASTGTTPQIRNNGSTTKEFYMWGAQMTEGNAVQPYYPTLLRANTPRIDYTDGSCPTLLLEGSVANTCLRSEEFDNEGWGKSNITVTPNTEIAPNGLMVADTLLATANNGHIYSNVSPISTVRRCFSVYLKRKTGVGDVILEVGNYVATATINSFTWTRCSVISEIPPNSNYTIVAGLHTITNPTPHNLYTGDVIRFNRITGAGVNVNTVITVTSPTEFTFSSGALTTSGTCAIYVQTVRIKMATLNDEVYVCGGQYEATAVTLQNGYYEPTSYIPTAGASVSRGSDHSNIYKLRENNIIGNYFSTFYEIRKIGGANSQDSHFMLSNTIIGQPTTAALYFSGFPLIALKIDGGSGTTVLPSTIYQPLSTNYYRCVITCNNGVFDIWVDGSKVATTTITNHALLNLINIGSPSANGIARFKQVLGWNRVINKAEIDSLFAYTYFNAGYAPINYELQDVINRANSEGFTIPSTAILGYCDTLITEMKNDGVWDVSDVYFNFAYNDIALSDWSRINWKNANGGLGIATFNGGLTYRVDGAKGDGIDGYVNTQYYPFIYTNINYQLNNAGRMMVISEDATVDGGYYDGTYSNRNSFLRRTSLATDTVRINCGANPISVGMQSIGIGLKSIMRDSSTDIRIQIANTLTNATQPSILDSTVIVQRLLSSSAEGTYSNSCMSTYWMGASLTNAQINNFRTYYNTFLTNVGLTAFA